MNPPSTTAVQPQPRPDPASSRPAPIAASPRAAAIARWCGDLAALALLVTVTWGLADHDGGLEPGAISVAAGVALLTLPWTAAELRFLPRAGRWLVALWTAATVVSLAFAQDRSGFPASSLMTGMVVATALSGLRLLRRRWGAAAITGALLVGFGAYWSRSYLQWWGHTMMGRDPTWMALSWHNQSGALMAGFGALFAGIAIAARRLVALAAGLCAGAALAGAWLSGSRGATAAAVVGLALVTALGARRHRLRRALGRAAAMVCVVVGITAALIAMSGGGQPVLDREEAASTNLALRLEHMRAAVGMFGDDPLTGQGPGSYARMALQWTSPDANLTAHAHNEYAEVLGESGIVAGVALVALIGAISVTAWRRRADDHPGPGAPTSADTDLREPLALGAGGSFGVLALHMGIDFDWNYLVLAALLAIAAAAIVDRHRLQRPAAGLTVLAVIPAILLLGVGLAAIRIELAVARPASDLTAEQFAASGVPWDVQHASQVSSTLAARGEYGLAAEVLDRAIAWSPGVHVLRVQRAVVAYRAGEATSREVTAVLDERRAPFWAHNLAAESFLARGDLRAARRLLHGLLDRYPMFAAWGVDRPLAETWALLVDLAGRQRGCDAARAAASDARREADLELGPRAHAWCDAPRPIPDRVTLHG
ncbi:MAG TPA: O-antigen ligase family protein [Nitriliruptorales bacterium]|nr:O-antigen ligase family protein [Nitriliruptorales bacterium]